MERRNFGNKGHCASECWGKPRPALARPKDLGALVQLVLTSEAFSEAPSLAKAQAIAEECLTVCAADLAEVYAPARFKERAVWLGFSAGLAADLDIGWDLVDDAQRERCSRQLAPGVRDC